MNRTITRALGAGLAANLLLAASAETPPSGSMFLEAGFRPERIEKGDFNGDGVVDLATMHRYFNGEGAVSFSVFLGRGDGTFEPRRSIAGATPLFMVAGDFDGDGVDELLSIAPGEEYESALYAAYGLDGDGDLVVLRTETLTAGTDAGDDVATGLRAVAADFNGDGRDDVALLLPDRRTYNLFLGFPGGFDQALMILPEGVTDALTAVCAHDLNDDGEDDLVLAYDECVVAWTYDDGAQTELISFELNDRVEGIVVGEFDGAGGPDLFVWQGNVVIEYAVLNDFIDNPPSPSTRLDEDGLGGGDAIAVDADGDGLDEVVTVDGEDGFAGVSIGISSILLNEQGVLRTAFPVMAPRLGFAPANVVMADFNSDGFPDLAAVNALYFNGAVTVALGQSGGQFGNVAASRHPFPGFRPTAAFVDINADGRPDILSEDEVYLNDQGRFDPMSRPISITEFGLPEGMLVDVDGDGDDDHVSLSPEKNLTTYLNVEGVFVEQPVHDLPDYEGSVGIWSTGPATVPGGGESILIYYRSNPDFDEQPADVIVLQHVVVGAYGEVQQSFDSPADTDTSPLTIVDFDGDGLGDLRFSQRPFSAVVGDHFVRLNDGAGGFIRNETPYARSGPDVGFEIELVDVNGDGRADRVVSVVIDQGGELWRDDASVRIELQGDDGAFVTSQTIGGTAAKGVAMHAQARSAIVGDFDLDGADDLCVQYSAGDIDTSHAYVMYPALGNGQFGDPIGLAVSPVYPTADSLDAADVDGDGDADILIGQDYRPSSSATATSTLANGVLYNRTDGVKASCVADFNGDGRVGPADLSLILAWWGASDGTLLTFDLDGDGVISAFDIAALLAQWGDCE